MVLQSVEAAMLACMSDSTSSSSLMVLGLIPARGGSKGLPRKNVRSLAGQPAIAYTCAAATASQRLSTTIVSTDDCEISEVASAFGVDVPFLRPAELATDSAASRDVVRHALDWWSVNRAPQPDLVVLLQPTAPMRTAADIDTAVDLLLNDPTADAVVSVTELPRHVHPNWQLTVDDDGQLQLYGGQPLNQIVTRRQDLNPTFTRNGAIYAVRTSAFNKTGGFYGNRCLAYVMPAERSINLDTMDDWHEAERLLKHTGVAAQTCRDLDVESNDG